MLILDVGSGMDKSDTARGNVCVDLRNHPRNKPENFVCADAHNLPFQSDVFNKVFYYDVIEHVENPTRTLQEIYRVLNNGTLELSTPNPLHWRRFFRALRGQELKLSTTEHIATWTQVELKNLLLNVGFHHVKFNYVILKVTETFDRRHMIYDKLVHNLVPRKMRAVTGRNIIVEAKK